MSTLNGMGKQVQRIQDAVPSPVDPLDDLRYLFTYVSDEDLAATRADPGNLSLREEILARARQRYKDGLPPFGPGRM